MKGSATSRSPDAVWGVGGRLPQPNTDLVATVFATSERSPGCKIMNSPVCAGKRQSGHSADLRQGQGSS